jgi:hypothetical protein
MDPYLDHPKSSMGCIKWMGMVEKQWFGSIMMVGCINSCSKIRICSAEFSTDLSTQTRLQCKTYSSWMDSYLDHPKSSMGCIKWIRMVEKQWFGSIMMVGRLSSPWKIRICPAEFSTGLNTQTKLLQDLQLMDPTPDHPKSSMGCIKCIKMIKKQWFG